MPIFSGAFELESDEELPQALRTMTAAAARATARAGGRFERWCFTGQLLT
jgi:hypothetical protein